MWKKIKHALIAVGVVIVTLAVFLLGRRSNASAGGNVEPDDISIGDIRDTAGRTGDALQGAREANESAAEAIHDSSGIVGDIAESNTRGREGNQTALGAVRTALAAARETERQNDLRRGD